MVRRARGTGGQKVQARKKVTTKLLERQHAGKTTTAYALLDDLVRTIHTHLIDAKIAIAWRFGWRADPDGRITLGQAKKGSDLDRELHGYDFVILLNHEAWNAASFSEAQMRALVDHELCHCQVMKDSSGEAKRDENGRIVYRIRRHDVEEFRDIVARHGLWKEDLERFAQAAIEHRSQPLLNGSVGAAAKATPAEPAGAESRSESPADPLATPIDLAGVLARHAKLLIEAGLDTVGKVTDYTASGKRLRDLKGIGPEAESMIAQSLESFWKEHPIEAARQYAVRIRLLRDIQGTDPAEGFAAGNEFDVLKYVNDRPTIAGANGMTLNLADGCYEVLESSSTAPNREPCVSAA